MRTKQGIVTSDAMDKSVVIAVHTYKNHPKYKKRYRVTAKFMAHDENNQYKVGDEVVIKETRPLSKRKCWEVAGYAKKSSEV